MLAGSFQADNFSVSFTPFFGYRYLFFAVQILSGEGLGVQQFIIAPGEIEFTAMNSRKGSNIYNMVGGFDHFRIMLNNQYAISNVPQRFKDVDETIIVAWVQANGGFVQYVQASNQGTTQRVGEADTLRFTTAKGFGQPVEGKVA